MAKKKEENIEQVPSEEKEVQALTERLNGVLESYKELELENEQLRAQLDEALEIIREQQSALENSAPANVSSQRVVTHQGVQYVFRYPVVQLGGRRVEADKATADDIAKLVEKKSAALKKI